MQLIDFMVCDDIRQEVGNKHSLMGIYGNSVTINIPDVQPDAQPVPLRLGIFVRIRLDPEDPAPTLFELTARQGERPPMRVLQPLLARSIRTVPSFINATVVIPQFPIYESGVVSFDITVKSGDVVINNSSPRNPFMDIKFIPR